MTLYLSKVIFDKDYHPKFYVKFHVLYNVTLGTSSFQKQCDDFIFSGNCISTSSELLSGSANYIVLTINLGIVIKNSHVNICGFLKQNQ